MAEGAEDFKKEQAKIYEKAKELAEAIAASKTISGSWHFSQFGTVIVFARGKDQEEAKKKAAEQASKPI